MVNERVEMSDLISRQTIDAFDVPCQEHRYKIPGERKTYSQYNEVWHFALDRAEGAIGNLPSAQPEIIHCGNCKHHSAEKPGMVYCPEVIDGWVKNDFFCALWEGKR